MYLGYNTESGKVVAKKRIPTTDAKETLAKSIEFFKEHPVAALGIGTFGPIDINPQYSCRQDKG